MTSTSISGKLVKRGAAQRIGDELRPGRGPTLRRPSLAPDATRPRDAPTRAVSSIALLGRKLARLYDCAYAGSVVQWDSEKAAANLRKHSVDFADAATVLSDEHALTLADDDPEEERFVTIGTDALGRLLVVAYTWRGDDARLISARKATASERRQYEKRR